MEGNNQQRSNNANPSNINNNNNPGRYQGMLQQGQEFVTPSQQKQKVNSNEQQGSENDFLMNAIDHSGEQLSSGSIVQNELPMDRLGKVKAQLKEQEENHKQQIIHVETIGMMTKYQLVFIKLECSLNKIANIFNMRQNSLKAASFSQISLVSQKIKATNSQYPSRLACAQMKKKLNKVFDVLQTRCLSCTSTAFSRIMCLSRLQTYHQKIQFEQDKINSEFNNILQSKHDQLVSYGNTQDQLNTSINILKARDTEHQFLLKQKDSIIANLQQELELKRQIKLNPNDLAQSAKLLEKRLRELEAENSDLRDKSVNTEGSVSLFLREMTELLDQHELTANISSDDNDLYSLNNNNNNNLQQNIYQNQLISNVMKQQQQQQQQQIFQQYQPQLPLQLDHQIDDAADAATAANFSKKAAAAAFLATGALPSNKSLNSSKTKPVMFQSVQAQQRNQISSNTQGQRQQQQQQQSYLNKNN